MMLRDNRNALCGNSVDTRRENQAHFHLIAPLTAGSLGPQQGGLSICTELLLHSSIIFQRALLFPCKITISLNVPEGIYPLAIVSTVLTILLYLHEDGSSNRLMSGQKAVKLADTVEMSIQFIAVRLQGIDYVPVAGKFPDNTGTGLQNIQLPDTDQVVPEK